MKYKLESCGTWYDDSELIMHFLIKDENNKVIWNKGPLFDPNDFIDDHDYKQEVYNKIKTACQQYNIDIQGKTLDDLLMW